MSLGDAKRILIVEDGLGIADMLGINLLGEGFVVERAASRQARTRVRTTRRCRACRRGR
jgi:DNA-binding response OmpR family regulator